MVKKASVMKELDRRVAVAPTMDWADEVRNLHGDRHLVPARTLRSLYVASIYKILRE